MFWTELTRKAYRAACMAHAGQVDAGGNPYIQHALAVAEQMPDEELAAAALLHDVLEDTHLTAADLLSDEIGMPPSVVRLVHILTRDPSSGMTYAQYIESIRRDPRAAIVKKADLRHNMDLSRLNREPTERDLSLQGRYRKSLEVLERTDL